METQGNWKWMRQAVDLAKRSVSETGRTDAPRVGVVIIKGDQVLAEGYRGQRAEGDHAEYCALKSLPSDAYRGATVYTTLEPCTKRSPGKIACAQRLVEAQVAEVVIGLYDPNPHVFRQGWRTLRDAGIKLGDFSADLRAELREANCDFLDRFRTARADRGSIEFDYVKQPSCELGGCVETRWTHASRGQIHAYGAGGHVTVARFAKAIEEVSDPAALDFDPAKYTDLVKDGEVVVFSNGAGTYAVILVKHVLSLDRGDSCNKVALEYEIRRPASNVSTASSTSDSLT